ncbi:hypothetical protein C8R45DRAFT_1165931 [Mycena sanguinolenta]|nr:hypothetical protein C8R45DRAFT_1165931 [Mycena sanguinolenta]
MLMDIEKQHKTEDGGSNSRDTRYVEEDTIVGRSITASEEGTLPSQSPVPHHPSTRTSAISGPLASCWFVQYTAYGAEWERSQRLVFEHRTRFKTKTGRFQAGNPLLVSCARLFVLGVSVLMENGARIIGRIFIPETQIVPFSFPRSSRSQSHKLCAKHSTRPAPRAFGLDLEREFTDERLIFKDPVSLATKNSCILAYWTTICLFLGLSSPPRVSADSLYFNARLRILGPWNARRTSRRPNSGSQWAQFEHNPGRQRIRRAPRWIVTKGIPIPRAELVDIWRRARSWIEFLDHDDPHNTLSRYAACVSSMHGEESNATTREVIDATPGLFVVIGRAWRHFILADYESGIIDVSHFLGTWEAHRFAHTLPAPTHFRFAAPHSPAPPLPIPAPYRVTQCSLRAGGALAHPGDRAPAVTHPPRRMASWANAASHSGDRLVRMMGLSLPPKSFVDGDIAAECARVDGLALYLSVEKGGDFTHAEGVARLVAFFPQVALLSLHTGGLATSESAITRLVEAVGEQTKRYSNNDKSRLTSPLDVNHGTDGQQWRNSVFFNNAAADMRKHYAIIWLRDRFRSSEVPCVQVHTYEPTGRFIISPQSASESFDMNADYLSQNTSSILDSRVTRNPFKSATKLIP